MKNRVPIVSRRSFGRAFVLCGMLLGLPMTGLAQEKEPFVEDPFAIIPSSLKVVYEVFALPLSQAAKLQRAGLSDDKMYERLLEGLKDETVKLETFLTVRGRADRPMSVAQGVDYRYPTEFDPPELPNMVEGPFERKTPEGKEMAIFPATASNPTSYQTRFLGKSLEVQAWESDDGVFTLKLEPRRTNLLKKDVYGRGKAKEEYPRFATPHLATSVSTTSGKPFLLGTVSPPVEQQPKKGEPVTHFAFVTATRLEGNKITEKE